MMPNYDIAELRHGCFKLPILRAALRSSGITGQVLDLFPMEVVPAASIYDTVRDLLARPQPDTREGKRDRAILAVLLGCALRRSELAALEPRHIQQRDGRGVFVDLVGKEKRIRTAAIPPFVKVAIDAWTAAAGLPEDPLFWRVRR
jgi:integrase